MGVDVDGYVFYGAIPLEPGDHWSDQDEEESDRIEALISKWNYEHGPAKPEGDDPRDSDAWDVWRQEWRRFQETGTYLTFGCAGSYDGMHYIGIAAVTKHSNWGEFVSLDNLTQPTEEQVAALTEFIEKNKLPYGKIGWYLTCMMG